MTTPHTLNAPQLAALHKINHAYDDFAKANLDLSNVVAHSMNNPDVTSLLDDLVVKHGLDRQQLFDSLFHQGSTFHGLDYGKEQLGEEGLRLLRAQVAADSKFGDVLKGIESAQQRVGRTSVAFQDLIADFQEAHPGINIQQEAGKLRSTRAAPPPTTTPQSAPAAPSPSPEPTPTNAAPSRWQRAKSRIRSWHESVFGRNDAQEAINEMGRQTEERLADVSNAPTTQSKETWLGRIKEWWSERGGSSSYVASSTSHTPMSTGAKIALGVGAAGVAGWAAYEMSRENERQQNPYRVR